MKYYVKIDNNHLGSGDELCDVVHILMKKKYQKAEVIKNTKLDDGTPVKERVPRNHIYEAINLRRATNNVVNSFKLNPRHLF